MVVTGIDFFPLAWGGGKTSCQRIFLDLVVLKLQWLSDTDCWAHAIVTEFAGAGGGMGGGGREEDLHVYQVPRRYHAADLRTIL